MATGRPQKKKATFTCLRFFRPLLLHAMVVWNFGMTDAAKVERAGDPAKAETSTPTVGKSYRHLSFSVGTAGMLALEPVGYSTSHSYCCVQKAKNEHRGNLKHFYPKRDISSSSSSPSKRATFFFRNVIALLATDAAASAAAEVGPTIHRR